MENRPSFRGSALGTIIFRGICGLSILEGLDITRGDWVCNFRRSDLGSVYIGGGMNSGVRSGACIKWRFWTGVCIQGTRPGDFYLGGLYPF